LRLPCLIGGANLRQPIVERFQPTLTLKTMARGFTFQFPFNPGPQKERADALAFAVARKCLHNRILSAPRENTPLKAVRLEWKRTLFVAARNESKTTLPQRP
jgi:hypothetical protein